MLLLDISIAGTPLAITVLVVVAALITFIQVMRSVYRKRAEGGLAEQYADRPGTSPLDGRNKYPGANVFKHSGTFFNLGLAITMGLTVLAFGWTQYEKVVDVSQYMDTLEEDIELEPPRTAEPPPPPPPPPPPVIEEVPEEEIIEEEEPEFVDQSVEADTEVEQMEPVEDAPPPPPPPL